MSGCSLFCVLALLLTFHFNSSVFVFLCCRLAIKLLSAMQNAWDCHCSEGDYKDLPGKLFKQDCFGNPIFLLADALMFSFLSNVHRFYLLYVFWLYLRSWNEWLSMWFWD